VHRKYNKLGIAGFHCSEENIGVLYPPSKIEKKLTSSTSEMTQSNLAGNNFVSIDF
jgi:hypothetical protein